MSEASLLLGCVGLFILALTSLGLFRRRYAHDRDGGRAVLRAIGLTFGSAVLGAAAAFLGALLYFNLIEEHLFPRVEGQGHGFHALALMSYLFGPPLGAIVGAGAAGVSLVVRRRSRDRGRGG